MKVWHKNYKLLWNIIDFFQPVIQERLRSWFESKINCTGIKHLVLGSFYLNWLENLEELHVNYIFFLETERIFRTMPGRFLMLVRTNLVHKVLVGALFLLHSTLASCLFRALFLYKLLAFSRTFHTTTTFIQFKCV